MTELSDASKPGSKYIFKVFKVQYFGNNISVILHHGQYQQCDRKLDKTGFKGFVQTEDLSKFEHFINRHFI